jgi:CheY-like chemotaxis protein
MDRARPRVARLVASISSIASRPVRCSCRHRHSPRRLPSFPRGPPIRRTRGHPKIAWGVLSNELGMHSSSGPRLSRSSILVIDDDDVLAQSIADAVRDAGHKPVTAHTLAEARSAIETERPGLVILDLTLEGEFGGDLLEELSQAPDAPAVLVVSAFALAKMVGDRYQVPVIEKPFGIEGLIAAIEQAFASNAQPRRVGT